MKNILYVIWNLIKPITVKGKDNVIKVKCPHFFKRISIRGNSNVVEIESDVQLGDVKIFLYGDNNKLHIDSKARLIGPCIIEMYGNAQLFIGENCGIRGVNFNVKDGKVSLGKLVMFSFGINIRNHDSHKVISMATGKQINSPKDIMIGNHVWICQNASILKGCNIGDDSIVAYGSVATKGCGQGCIIAGNPAQIVKENITWDY